MDIIFIQTSDPFRYRPMLAITAENVASYCERHGFGYESFVGIKRGVWPWQASYNRLFQLRDLAQRGFRGWVIHLDADAWINDPDFDLRLYLSDKTDRAVVMAAAGDSGMPWDINNGVMFVNLGTEPGRRLVDLWMDAFLAIPSAEFNAARDWLVRGNDQDLLQGIVRTHHDIAASVLIESQAFMNSRRARFIRQHLRSDTGDVDRRIRNIEQEVAAVRSKSAASATMDDRALYTLRRSNSHELQLVRAPDGPPAWDAARSAIEHWKRRGPCPSAPHHASLFEALEQGDADAVDRLLRGFGRSPAATGLLGGPQQHERAARDPAFARMRALRIKDALTSLAEACGAIDFENPVQGLWGFNVQIPTHRMLARIGKALNVDATPPRSPGAYLGLDIGDGTVLHLRMVQALHTAWRAQQVQQLLRLPRIVELDGGVGYRALYAARLGVRLYEILDNALIGAIQTYVLQREGVTLTEPADGDDFLLVNEETLPEQDPDIATERLRHAHDRGAKAILSINHEAQADAQARRRTARDIVLSTGRYRLMQRTPHALRPGFVEELFLAV